MVARFYDRMMAHVNYGVWCRWLQRVFAQARRDVKDVADISCGTGRHLALLEKAGYACYGADFALPMLQQATRHKTLQGRLWQQDARHSAVRAASFDAVIMLFDSVNYLLEAEDVRQTLQQVYDSLRPGGLFVFDTVTEYMIVTHMTDYYETNTWEDVAYERRSYYDADKQLQHNDFSILKDGALFKENHCQRIWSHEAMMAFIDDSPWDMLDIQSEFKRKKIGPKTERIHYILLKR